MLAVRDLTINFSSYTSRFGREESTVIRALDLDVEAGQMLAIAGQSGAGKSLLAQALLGILPRNACMQGEISYNGLPLTPKRMKALRGKEIALVPQSVAYLNPLLRVGVQMGRAAALGGVAKENISARISKMLGRYHLPPEVAELFPHQISGGMARRIMTISATIGGAKLIIADEPTNGLDTERTRKMLHHLRHLADMGKAVVLITHDLAAAVGVADRVSVFCGGVTVEETEASYFTGDGRDLKHPYSRALWQSLPTNGFQAPEGAMGALCKKEMALGCPYAGNCVLATDHCRDTLPPIQTGIHGKIRCHYA